MSKGAHVPKRRSPSGMARERDLAAKKRAELSSAMSPPTKDRFTSVATRRPM